MTERVCPYCGAIATSTWAEIEHMNSIHPGIIAERLLNAGFSWSEIEDRLQPKSEQIYEYKKVNISTEPKTTIEAAANRWAAMGWRTVAVMQVSGADRRGGYADSILVERRKEINGE